MAQPLKFEITVHSRRAISRMYLEHSASRINQRGKVCSLKWLWCVSQHQMGVSFNRAAET